MNRPVHFEIHTKEPERTIKFYTEVFGWQFTDAKMGAPYWMIMTAEKDSKDPGINGGMVLRAGSGEPVEGAAVNAFVVTIDVPAYDETHEKVLKAGGTVAHPKMAIPGMAWLGYYKDLEGNIFGIFQEDKSAK